MYWLQPEGCSSWLVVAQSVWASPHIQDVPWGLRCQNDPFVQAVRLTRPYKRAKSRTVTTLRSMMIQAGGPFPWAVEGRLRSNCGRWIELIFGIDPFATESSPQTPWIWSRTLSLRVHQVHIKLKRWNEILTRLGRNCRKLMHLINIGIIRCKSKRTACRHDVEEDYRHSSWRDNILKYYWAA